MATINYDSDVTADTALVTTAETVVATLSGVTTGRRNDVRLRGWAELTTGTNTTSVTPRIRRGTDATGTLIGEGNPRAVAAAAGSTEEFDVEGVDAGADLSGATYVLTLQQAGATANGSCLRAALHAEIRK